MGYYTIKTFLIFLFLFCFVFESLLMITKAAVTCNIVKYYSIMI